MPLYDVDKATVVLDIGTAYTKFGFTGEYSPRSIIRSEIQYSNKQTRKLWEYKNTEDLYDLLVDFLHVIYFKYALISPKEKPIVIVESLLCPTVFRETLAKVLFKHYGVSMIYLLPGHLVSMSTLAIDSGLVIDMGYSEVVVFPICFGVPIITAWQALPIASQTIHENLKSLLSSNNTGIQNVSEKVLEDIKVRCCFVTSHSRAQQSSKSEFSFCPDIEYPMAGSDVIIVSGRTREKAYEILFKEDNDHLSLPTMILDAILKVGVDLRRTLAENILLIGGTAMVPGLKSRLKEELKIQLANERYKTLHLPSFKFHTAPSKENSTAWFGGSIYGVTEWLNTKSVTREMYFTEKKLPDWASVNNSRRT